VPVANAGTTVDPETLIPPPPPGSQCTATGAFIICATSFEVHTVNEPILDFDLPCGTIYETIDDVRRGIRWYDVDDLTIVKRLVFQQGWDPGACRRPATALRPRSRPTATGCEPSRTRASTRGRIEPATKRLTAAGLPPGSVLRSGLER
jgi:hypothetical protein